MGKGSHWSCSGVIWWTAQISRHQLSTLKGHLRTTQLLLLTPNVWGCESTAPSETYTNHKVLTIQLLWCSQKNYNGIGSRLPEQRPPLADSPPSVHLFFAEQGASFIKIDDWFRLSRNNVRLKKISPPLTSEWRPWFHLVSLILSAFLPKCRQLCQSSFEEARGSLEQSILFEAKKKNVR